MANGIPIFAGVDSLEPNSITVELRSDSSLYDAMDVIDKGIGEGGTNDGLYPSLYRFLLRAKKSRYLILEKAKSIWDEHDTKALMKKVKDVKAKMEFKQTKKGKGRMTGDLSDMESFCSTSQKIFDEFGKLGRFFKSYNDNFLNCKTPQTAASVVSCAPMVGTSFAVLVPILETINASGKVRAGIPQHLERVVKTLQALHAMAIFGKKYDLKTEDYETYCSYMVLLGKLIYKLGEMDDQRNGSWKRTKRLWLANEDTTELIELKEELDATELETAALKSLENNVIFNKLLEIVEALNVASPKK